ncbi:MAG: O-antigen ligase family protein [Chitinophagaceae bacterium]|nr:O-antigen ligase family protein [Chitinophagaceae bacterium]
MARKKPTSPFSDKQIADKQGSTNFKTENKSSWIPMIIVGLYMAVHFITNMNAIDVMGPQWLYVSLLDILVVMYIWARKDLYKDVILSIYRQLYTKLYLSLFLLAGLSIFFAMNQVEAWVCFVRFIVTLIAFFNLAILFANQQGSFILICRLLAAVLLVESIQYFNKLFDGIAETSLGALISSLNGNTGNKNIFAASLVIKIPFVLYALYQAKLAERIFLILALTLGIATIFMASARASYVSLILVSLFFLGFLFVQFLQQKKADQLLLRSAYLLLPLLSAFFITQAINTQVTTLQQSNSGRYGSVIGNISSIALTNDASSYRFKLWEHAFDYIAENPLMGCGYGNWKLASIPYEKEYIDDLNVPAHAHNDFLEHAAELGLLGGLLYLSLYVCLFYCTIKTLRSTAGEQTKLIALFSFMALIVYAVDAGLNFPIERAIMQVFFACVTAINLGSYIKAKQAINDDNTVKVNPTFSLAHPLYGIITILILLPTTYVTYLTYVSLKAQFRVVPDLKNEPMSIPLTEVKTMFPPIPNLTSSSQPIDAILGRYHSENKQYDEALRLLRKAIPHNPHIYYSQFLMANVFFNTDQMDSAKYYAEMAYYNKPRANTYYQTLVAVHAKRRDTAGIAKAFRTYTKYRNEPFAWNLYLMGLLNSLQKGTPELLKLADSALNLFGPKGSRPASETDYANLMQRKQEITNNINFSGTISTNREQTATSLQQATQIYNEGVVAFTKQDYKTAAAKFVRAAEINAFNYAIYENAGVSFFNLNQFRKAIFYFDKVIALKISNDGKSEFFKGISHINLGEKELGCQTLQIAKSKNYNEANNIIAQYCNK